MSPGSAAHILRFYHAAACCQVVVKIAAGWHRGWGVHCGSHMVAGVDPTTYTHAMCTGCLIWVRLTACSLSFPLGKTNSQSNELVGSMGNTSCSS